MDEKCKDWDAEWEDPRWSCGLDSRLRSRLKDGFASLEAGDDDGDDWLSEASQRDRRNGGPKPFRAYA